jgi:hypothetical protein
MKLVLGAFITRFQRLQWSGLVARGETATLVPANDEMSRRVLVGGIGLRRHPPGLR